MADTEVTPAAPQTPPLPSELPVVPLRDTVVLPMTVAPLGVGRPVSIEAINRALASDRMVLLLLQTRRRRRSVARRPPSRGHGCRHPADGQGADRHACARRRDRAGARGVSPDRSRIRSRPVEAAPGIDGTVDRHRRASAAAPGARGQGALARHRSLARHQDARDEPRRSAADRLPRSPACST